MTHSHRFTPHLHPNESCPRHTLARLNALLRTAPASYAGNTPAIAISREILPHTRGGLAVTADLDFSIHRGYPNDPIAGQALFDELSAEEADHFEPAFRLLHAHNPSSLLRDPFLTHILQKNRDRWMTLAYMDGAIALFPSHVEDALGEVDITSLEDGPDIVRGSICTILVHPPDSHHQRLELSERISKTSARLAKILHGHMAISFEDGHLEAQGLAPCAYAQAAACW